MFWKRTERQINALYTILKHWRTEDMAYWAEIKGKVDALKDSWKEDRDE